MRVAYLDAFSGISGDMTVGALLDLGVPLDAVRDAIATLAVPGIDLASERVFRHGIAATKFHVRVDGRHPDPPEPETPADHHHHGGAPDAPHDHHHHPDDPAAHDGHRPYAEIRRLLEGSALVAPVKERALAIFARLAEAEGRVHGNTAADVEFHEVGARDAIVDIVGAAVGFVALGIEAIYASPLPVGQGRMRSAHGILPVPAPATMELLRDRAVRFEDGVSELVTPTGAAIVAALAAPGTVPVLRPLATGYGAGDRVLADRPNLLRIVLGEIDGEADRDEVVVLEATIDDMNPQVFEHVVERLLAAGARDVFLAPVVMKKSRPATLLRVLAAPADRSRLAGVIFAETTTIGLRYTTWQRMVLPREERTVETPFGAVRVKIAIAPDGTRNIAPEFDDCRRLAVVGQIPLKVVHQAALVAALRM